MPAADGVEGRANIEAFAVIGRGVILNENSDFEGLLADVQSEMIAASLEYAGNGVSDVYIYASTENGSMFFDPFFVVDGEVVGRGKLLNADTSIPRQRLLMKYGSIQLLRLWEAGTKYGRTVPSQLKLHYVVASGSLDAKYEYDAQHSNHRTLTVHDISGRWQDEIRGEAAGRY
ncbi:hypothetical protein [Sinomonas sp. P47F7]|uniref:hypothetical protein n=1 Tax=Sinomonas sp. P47F7 TaxID=3410987 RepID=UPI003BF50BC8